MKDIEIAIRNFKRNKTNTAIIIISLALGFACLNLITTFLVRELGTDNFQVDKDRIYSIIGPDAYSKHNGNISYGYDFNAEAEEYIKNNFEQVEDVCTYNGFDISKISFGNNRLTDELQVIETSANFFIFFSYPLVIGNPKLVLENNSDVVISDKLAQKLFGNEPPLGQTIEIERYSNKYLYNITGVFKKPDQNSQLSFDMVMKIDPKRLRKGYLKVARSSNAAEVESLFTKYKSEIPISSTETLDQYYLKSLKDTYFDENRIIIGVVENSQARSTIWMVACVGLLIMALAMFNFMGIVNYNLLDRAKSYSIYQLNGANKIQLLLSILTEVALLLLTSFLMSLALLKWIVPVFKRLVNTSIENTYAFQLTNLVMLLLVLLFAFLIVSLFAIYKLNTVMGYSALNGIKTNLKFQLPVLNVFQLAVTILLIISSLTIVKQINFINNHNIGIDKEVIHIRVPLGMQNKLGIPETRNKLGVIKNKLDQLPSIKSAAFAENTIFSFARRQVNYYENGEERSYSPSYFDADEYYVETLGFKVKLGRNFTSNPVENRYTCLINESMAKYLKRDDIIGSKLPGSDNVTIVGVVEDFNYQDLRSTVYPAIINWADFSLEPIGSIFIKPANVEGNYAIDDIKKAWEEVFPDVPFEYTTTGQQYERLHSENKKTIHLVILSCAISILLSMMGLFAVVLQNAKLRTKEIGIRKVNGAKISEVMFLLNQDFVKWVIVAFIVSMPIAYYAMYKWLQNFAYKTELSWWVFGLAGLLALGIALLTVSFQSWKAATKNPVESLRYE